MSGVAIRPGVPAAQRSAAAFLYWQAFAEKLGRTLGPEPQALAYLARVMREDQVLSACDADGQLIGLGGFRTAAGAFAIGRWPDMAAVYGRGGAAWRAAALHLLAQDHDPAAFLIDGLAVAPAMRGRGIGTALIAALCHEARTRGHGEVWLDVADGNTRARALYERLGFTARHSMRTGVVGPLFGIASVTRMVRPL